MYHQDWYHEKGLGISSRTFSPWGVDPSWQWLGITSGVTSFQLAGQHFPEKQVKFRLSPPTPGILVLETSGDEVSPVAQILTLRSL